MQLLYVCSVLLLNLRHQYWSGWTCQYLKDTVQVFDATVRVINNSSIETALAATNRVRSFECHFSKYSSEQHHRIKRGMNLLDDCSYVSTWCFSFSTFSNSLSFEILIKNLRRVLNSHLQGADLPLSPFKLRKLLSSCTRGRNYGATV